MSNDVPRSPAVHGRSCRMRFAISALRRQRGMLCVVAAVLATGCATYEPKPLDPDRSAAEFSARRLDDPALHEAVVRLLPNVNKDWPPQSWGRAELLAVAMTTNGKLAVARAQIDAALAHEITAGQTPNPELALQSEYARHDPHPWLYGLGLDFLVRGPGAKNLDVELARLETSDARWQLLDQIWSVRRALTGALSDREAARRRSGLLDRLAEAQARIVTIEEKRVAAGEDPPKDLLTERQTQLDISQQRADARLALATSQSTLAAAIGMPQDVTGQLTTAWPDWGEPLESDRDALRALREQALRSRSDLAAAIGEYAQTENKLHQAVLRQYPQFHLSPGYYWDHGIAKFPFDIGFTPPLFNHNEGEIAETRAARDVAGKRMLATQATIFGDIDVAEITERIARENVGVATNQVAFAHKQQENVRVGVRLGDAEIGEQIRTDALALRSELELLQMRAQLQTARNALEDALHAPLSGPELQLPFNTVSRSEVNR